MSSITVIWVLSYYRLISELIRVALDQVPKLLTVMEKWLLEGRLRNKNHPIRGLENAPSGLQLLHKGGNTGKVAVYINE